MQKVHYTWPLRERRSTKTPSRPIRDIQDPQVSPRRHASSCCKDGHHTVRSLRWATSTSSPLLPAKVFTEDSPTKAELKRRVSSLETVSHDLSEENEDLRESLEGEAKKRAKEVKKISKYFSNLFSHIHTPIGNAG